MKKQISRRDFLKIAVIGAGAATLGACAPKATPTSEEPPSVPAATSVPPTEAEAPIVEVEVTTSGWPVDVKSPDDIAADVTNKAYAEAVQAWLDKNPGVTFTKVDVNIWDPQAIQAAVAGGTDCTYLFAPCVGGGWGRTEAMNAFAQGMLADVSPAVVSHGLEGKCLPDMWKGWSNGTQVNGKFWAYPLNETAPSADTMAFRKDILSEKGLPLPNKGWTFQEYKDLLKKATDPSKNLFGAAHPSWWIGQTLAMHGYNILSRIPTPTQPWHWTIDNSDPRWVEVIKAYREMVYEDMSLYSDVALGGGDDEYLNLFKAGQCVFVRANFWTMFGAPTDPTSFAAMANNLGKKYSDVFSTIIMPTGDGYQQSGGTDNSGGVSISPNAKPEALDKGVGLVDWMFFGKGLDMTKAGIWEATNHDPMAVFSAFIYMDGRKGKIYDGVDATPADAWGQDIIDRFLAMAGMPFEPTDNYYFPAEQNPSPATTALDDQMNLLATDPNANDIAGLLKKGLDDYTATLGGFSSSVSEADFKASAQKWYTVLEAHYKANYPEFYEKRFKPHYEARIIPAIG